MKKKWKSESECVTTVDPGSGLRRIRIDFVFILMSKIQLFIKAAVYRFIISFSLNSSLKNSLEIVLSSSLFLFKMLSFLLFVVLVLPLLLVLL